MTVPGLRINEREVQLSNVLCPLIWKALFKAGYDIPETFFDNIPLKSDKIAEFDGYCCQLSRIEGWPNYAIYCLLNYNIALENHRNLPGEFLDYTEADTALNDYFIAQSLIIGARENNYNYFER